MNYQASFHPSFEEVSLGITTALSLGIMVKLETGKEKRTFHGID